MSLFSDTLFQQVDAVFQVVLAEAAAKVVQGANIKVAFRQVVVTESIANLNIEAEMVIQFFITPAKAGLEGIQGYQDVDRDVGPGRQIGVQAGKGLFLQPTEELAVKLACPGLLQALAVFVGSGLYISEQGGL